MEDAKNDLYDVILHVGDLAYDMHENNGGRADDFFSEMQPAIAHVPVRGCVPRRIPTVLAVHDVPWKPRSRTCRERQV